MLETAYNYYTACFACLHDGDWCLIFRDGPCLRKADLKNLNGETNFGVFNSSRNKIIDQLVDCLSKRFSDVADPVLRASSIASLQLWPENLVSNRGVTIRNNLIWSSRMTFIKIYIYMYVDLW